MKQFFLFAFFSVAAFAVFSCAQERSGRSPSEPELMSGSASARPKATPILSMEGGVPDSRKNPIREVKPPEGNPEVPSLKPSRFEEHKLVGAVSQALQKDEVFPLEVEGQPVTNWQDVLKLMGKLGGDTFQVRVRRVGADRKVNFAVITIKRVILEHRFFSRASPRADVMYKIISVVDVVLAPHTD